MDVQMACEMLSRVQNGKRPPLTDTEKAELAVMTDKPINSEPSASKMSLRRSIGLVLMSFGFLCYAFGANPHQHGAEYFMGMFMGAAIGVFSPIKDAPHE